MSNSYTVMIVDDSPEDRYLLKRYLKKTELSLVVMEAAGGIEALETLKKPASQLETEYPGISAPITIFLDINMPLMNGWEFIEALDAHKETIELRPTVVLMYSTSDDDADKQRAAKYNSVSSYIVKGESTPESLKQAILSHR